MDLQGVFVNIGDFIELKGFSCGIPREQALLRKSKPPRKSPAKWTFLSLTFYNAPSLHTVEIINSENKNYVCNLFGCSIFAYSRKLPAYSGSGAFLLTIDKFCFFTYSWSFLAYSFSCFTYDWSFFAYNGKVRLIRALRDCKQRSSTASKKVPALSKKWEGRKVPTKSLFEQEAPKLEPRSVRPNEVFENLACRICPE